MEIEKYVAHNTGSLVISSTFFLVPCIYAFYNGMHFFTVLLILTSGVSGNYWRKATYGWRRTLDLWFSKLSFVIFVANQYMYIWIVPPNHIGFSIDNIRYYSSIVCFCNMVYFYYLSEKYYHNKSEQWRTYHFIFHIFVALEQIIILESKFCAAHHSSISPSEACLHAPHL